MKSLATGLNLVLFGVCLAELIGPSWAQEVVGSPSTPPPWVDQILGRVNFNTDGESRKRDRKNPLKDDYVYYRINPKGVITGKEFMELNAGAYFEVSSETAKVGNRYFETKLIENPASLGIKDPQTFLATYRQKIVDVRMAILILNRILDNESLKRKIEPNVSPERLDFIVRSSLVYLCADLGILDAHRVIGTNPWIRDSRTGQCRRVQEVDSAGKASQDLILDQDPSSLTNTELYKRFLSVARERGLPGINVSNPWIVMRGEGWSMGKRLERLRDTAEDGWPMQVQFSDHLGVDPRGGEPSVERDPVFDAKCGSPIRELEPVSFSIAPLPDSYLEFVDKIKISMQHVYRKHVRRQLWGQMLRHKSAQNGWMFLGESSPDMLDRLYEGFKATTDLIAYPRLKSVFNEITVSGRRANAFAQRYQELLKIEAVPLIREYQRIFPADRQFRAEELHRRTIQVRREIQARAFQQALKEFSSNDVRASVQERELFLGEGEVPEEGMQLMFDSGAFEMTALAYASVKTGQDKSATIRIPIALSHAPLFKDRRTDPNRQQIDDFLRGKLVLRIEGLAQRELAYELFQRNVGVVGTNAHAFEFVHQFSDESDWPPSMANQPGIAPRILTDALFPEALLPNASLPASIKSTLGHRDLYGQVMSISTRYLEDVFAAPNDYVEPRAW